MKDIHTAGRPIKKLGLDFSKQLLMDYEHSTTRQLAHQYNVTQPTICNWLTKARAELQEVKEYIE